MVFVTTGLGGGTGTGAAPIIASLASEMGALTVAVVTKPFSFEGKRRMQQAERGISELMESVDTTIVIPNEKLLAVAEDAGFFESFRIADDILRQGVQGISDIITIPGIINRDFADVKTIMAGMGYAVMGTASASGAKRTIEAAQRAIASPLLEAGAIDGARGILINITGSSSLKLAEVQQACSIIQGAAHEDANIIFGAVMDEKMKDAVKITVIATGFREVSSGRHHHQETHKTFSAQHDDAMDFPEAFGSRDPEPPKHIMSDADMSHEMTDDRSFHDRSIEDRSFEDRSFDDRPYADEPAPAMAQVAPEPISLDSMRTNVLTNMAATFEQDDLDVPAFLRKRNEVM
jgi:cell division protein FtsZ